MQRRVSLNDVVEPGQRVPPEDLGQVRFAMSRLGLFDPARELPRKLGDEESLMGGGLRRALGAFQAGQGLREDSTLRPGGPTEQRLNLLLEQNKGLRVADPDDALTLERERTPGALLGRVGPGLENHPDDVATVSTVLRQLGVLKPGTPNPTKTGPVFGGLMSFQRQNGLARDATITPDGPTEQLLVQQLSSRAPGTQGLGTPTPLINATEASFRTAPAGSSPVAPPTDPQRSSLTHPLGRLSQQQRQKADQEGGSPQLDAEQRDAQRQDAQRMLDRIIQCERGELVDRTSDQVGTTINEQDFFAASPEKQDGERDRLRRLAKPNPALSRARPTPSEGFAGAKGSSLFTRRQAPLLHDQPLKGTTFFPGAGMAGRYIPDVVEALGESGIANARSVDPEVWSNGAVADLASVPTERDRDGGPSDFARFSTEGEQFNLIGFSYGGLQAAQAAADYADFGGKVDHLILIGTPISGEFLTSLQEHPNIGAVKIIDLQDKGDPTRAGADFDEFGSTIGELAVQSFDSEAEIGRANSTGHFYYTGDGDEEEGKRRRRALARELFDFGLR